MTGHQLSFLPQLSEDEPLLPFVVLPTNERWNTALDEFEKCEWFGLDTEFWEDARLRSEAVRSSRTLNNRSNFDDWSTRLRLVQCGLPSGLVLVADFGLETPQLPIQIPGHKLERFLLILGRKLRCRKTSKFGQTLNTEARILRRHFGFVLRRVRDTMLASQVVYAGVGSKAWAQTEFGRVKRAKLRHRLVDIADRVGVVLDKTEQLGDWSAPKLSNKQYNYAAKDVHRDTLLKCWSGLAKKAKEDSIWPSVLIECEAAPAFYECEWRGMTFDREETLSLVAKYEKIAEACFATLRRYIGQQVAIEGPGSKESVPLALTRWLHNSAEQERLAVECERQACTASADKAKALREAAAQHRSAPYFWAKQKYGQKVYESYESMTPEEAQERGFEREALCLYRWEQKKTKLVRSGLSMGPEEAKAEKFSLQPEMSETQLSAFDKLEPVIALLEGRSCRNTASVLQGRLDNAWIEGDKDTWLCTACGHWVEQPYHCGEAAILGTIAGRLAARCKYWQIAGNEDDSGAGTGRSSSSDPFNAQNLTSYPLGEGRHKELKLPSAKSSARPQPGRSMFVGDFSQAHMRFAAQESLDPGLCDDFKAGRDAHIRLAASLAREQGDLSAEFGMWCKVYQKGDKKDPIYAAIKKVRQPAKVGNYTCLCFGGVGSMAKTAATDRDPIHLPEEVWVKTREAWRKTYEVLYATQKKRIRETDSNTVNFEDIGVPGEYGIVWSVNRDRRVYHLKEWNVPMWANAEGRYSVKGTEVIASIWQTSEANALKDALARVLEHFDRHPEWQAFIINAVHDEIDAESRSEVSEAVSTVVFEEMRDGLIRAGITEIPVIAPGDCPAKLIVKSWADK